MLESLFVSDRSHETLIVLDMKTSKILSLNRKCYYEQNKISLPIVYIIQRFFGGCSCPNGNWVTFFPILEKKLNLKKQKQFFNFFFIVFIKLPHKQQSMQTFRFTVPPRHYRMISKYGPPLSKAMGPMGASFLAVKIMSLLADN